MLKVVVGSLLIVGNLALGSTNDSKTAANLLIEQGSSLDLPRSVIATGGGRSAGGVWVIRGTIGQSDADPLQPSTDGASFYAITGGFWPALPAPQTDGLFIDGFEAQADSGNPDTHLVGTFLQ